MKIPGPAASRLRPLRRVAAVFALLGLAACVNVDPRAELDLSDLETYWAVDRTVGETHFIAPTVRFRLRNKGDKKLRSVQVNVTFRRKGEEKQSWGSAFRQVSDARKPLGPGEMVQVVLTSDGRYSSAGTPESMLRHELFKDAVAEVYVKAGASQWVPFATADVERRIGARGVQSLLGSPAPSP